MTQREALRDRIRGYVQQHLRDPQLSVDAHRPRAQLQPAPPVQRLRRRGRVASPAYIQRLRLQACVRDLQQAGPHARPITDIALSWGFGNPSHFSRVFRDHTGMTPSAFRHAPGH